MPLRKPTRKVIDLVVRRSLENEHQSWFAWYALLKAVGGASQLQLRSSHNQSGDEQAIKNFYRFMPGGLVQVGHFVVEIVQEVSATPTC